jgi:hypothetical protein
MPSARATTHVEQLVENQYVQERLSKAATNLRAAYRRASKRRTNPATDRKLRDQLRRAWLSINEAAAALKSGRTRQKGQRTKRLLVVLVVGAGGAAAALAGNKQLRTRVLGGSEPPASAPSSDATPAEPTPAGVA